MLTNILDRPNYDKIGENGVLAPPPPAAPNTPTRPAPHSPASARGGWTQGDAAAAITAPLSPRTTALQHQASICAYRDASEHDEFYKTSRLTPLAMAKSAAAGVTGASKLLVGLTLGHDSRPYRQLARTTSSLHQTGYEVRAQAFRNHIDVLVDLVEKNAGTAEAEVWIKRLHARIFDELGRHRNSKSLGDLRYFSLEGQSLAALHGKLSRLSSSHPELMNNSQLNDVIRKMEVALDRYGR